MSIIAISGYAGSGKDLAAMMIQHHHLTPELQLDNPVHELMNEDTWWLDDVSGWEIRKFAGKLKSIASILTGIPVQKFEDQAFKKTTLGPEWARAIPGEDWVNGKPVLVPMTVRDFLQKLGTDGLRDGLHENTWVNALMADYVPRHEQWTEGSLDIHKYGLLPNWIITDCRFPNEAKAVRERDGVIIRINRPGVTAVNAHPSETALDDYDFDDVIVNDGSIQDLYEKVKFTIEKHNVCYP
jgi:hypothetical protein